MLDPDTVLQSRYRVVRALGQGGMGTVYEAIDERVRCLVALKETQAGTDADSLFAFEREAALLANLRHPALPKVMDYFMENHGQFLVMEFIPGYDLSELLEVRGGAFPQEQVLRWADELLKVLEYLHGLQPPILHRDIKPANLKMTRQGEIFLLDFGLAKGAAGQMSTLMTSRSVRGYTPVYAPIEQITGRGTDARSDLYSLGATLYHLLTATYPADAATRFAAMEDDQPDPLRPAHLLNRELPVAVSEVIHRALAVSRKFRPASAAEMRQALRQAGGSARHAASRQGLQTEVRIRQEAERLHQIAAQKFQSKEDEQQTRNDAGRQVEEQPTLRLPATPTPSQAAAPTPPRQTPTAPSPPPTMPSGGAPQQGAPKPSWPLTPSGHMMPPPMYQMPPQPMMYRGYNPAYTVNAPPVPLNPGAVSPRVVPIYSYLIAVAAGLLGYLINSLITFDSNLGPADQTSIVLIGLCFVVSVGSAVFAMIWPSFGWKWGLLVAAPVSLIGLISLIQLSGSMLSSEVWVWILTHALLPVVFGCVGALIGSKLSPKGSAHCRSWSEADPL
ncbi:MAG TPA: protein kinase [Pyrinomonadaceae bacterium]